MQKFVFYIIVMLCFVLQGRAQDRSIDSLRMEYDKSYGLDVLLHNGKKYFAPGNPIAGHPFWKTQDAFTGAITIYGQRFTNQQLKYDLNKQQFVLFYTNYNGQPGQIVLNNGAIDSVSIGNCLFVRNTNPEIHLPFVQLIHKGQLTCTIAWNKDVNLNATGQTAGYEYTKDYSRRYLNYKGTDYRFNSKSTFLRIFDQKERVPIRKYLSSNHLKFKKMTDHDLRKIIQFCEQTLN